MTARTHNHHVPSFSAKPKPLYLGVQSTSTAGNTALAAALANKDFIQSQAMYSFYLGQPVLLLRHLNGRGLPAPELRVLCSTNKRGQQAQSSLRIPRPRSPRSLAVSPETASGSPFGNGWNGGCQIWSPGTFGRQTLPEHWISGFSHKTDESRYGTRYTLSWGGRQMASCRSR